MRDSDRPMTQREAYQRGYAAGYAAAQSGPPREPTREMTLAGQRALDNIWTSWHAPTTQCWRAMYDAWQNEQTGGKAMPATGLSSPDHAGSAGPPDHIEQTGGPIARGEPINQPELRSGPPDHQSAATPSNLSGGSSQEGADGPAADPLPVAWATPSLLVTMSAVEKRLLTSPEMRGRGGGWEADARDADRYSVPLYRADALDAALERLRAERAALRECVRAADAMYASADHTGGNPGCNKCDAADDFLAARAKVKP